MIPDIAKEIGATGVIDVYEKMGGIKHKQYYYFCNGQNCDSVHPNDAGYYRIASIVYGSLFGPGVDGNKPKSDKW